MIVDLGKQLDCAMPDLLILDHQLFTFTDESTYVETVKVVGRNNKLEGPSHHLVIITLNLYWKMKANLGTYDMWLGTDHLDLVLSWFMHNHNS